MLRIGYPFSNGSLSCALLALLSAPGALAQLPPATEPPAQAATDTASVTGRSLFEQAKALYEADNLEEACAKFAESHRIAPSTVALLGLAACHRDQGKLGTAWSEYLETRARAQRERNTELEAHAERFMRELQPRLSTLLVEVSPEVAKIPGLSVRVDGTAFAPEAWNRVRAYDGGQHTVEANAPGRDPWRMSVTLRQEADELRVPIAVLEQAEIETAPRVQASPPPPAMAPVQVRETSNSWDALEWWGVASAGAGIAAGIASWQLRYTGSADALTQADADKHAAANWLSGVGIGLGALGVTLFIVGQTTGNDASSSQVALSLHAPASGSWAASVCGSF